MNSFAGVRADVGPSAGLLVVSCEQEQDFGLHRIRVLELVHEDAREALLQMPPHAVIHPQKVARAGEQIREVERALPAFERLVFRDRLRNLTC